MYSPEQGDATEHGEPMEIDREPKKEIITAEELARIRAHWWECRSLDDLNRLVQLAPATKEIIKFQYNMRPANEDFRTLLKTEATVYVSRAQDNCVSVGLDGFQKLVIPPPEEDIGSVIAIYLSLLNVFGSHSRSNPETCRHVLRQLSPRLPADDRSPDRKLAKLAFHQKPARRDTTTALYRRILGYYKAYRETAIYFSPFTSVIGPSGIGKSFLTKQLAHQNHAYVVYVCLATNDAHLYPLQSPTANLFARPSTRDQMTTFVDCFIAAGLAHVKLCRLFGINTAGFYELQVQENFASLQNIFRDCLEEFFNKVMGDLRAAGKTRRVRSNDVEPDEDYDYTEYVDRSLAWYESLLAPVFGELKKELEKSDVFQCFLSTEPIALGLEPGEPAAIICFDEARSPFSQEPKDGPMRYLALRRALRNRWHSAEQPNSFSLLLDTSSRVTELSPPRHRDPSSKYPHDNEMFPPIFQINTMDLFVEGSQSYDPNNLLSTDPKKVEITRTHFYSFGRPLWGAYLKAAGMSATGFQRMVLNKLFPHEMSGKSKIEPTDAVALISYRINLYTALYSLTETLTSENLRYVVGINAERTLIQTLHPSEPVLAFSAGQQLLMHSDLRLAAFAALYDNVSKGFIHLGDVGEDVASLILLFTFDRAHGLRAPRPIKLSSFIAMLLPPMGKEQVRLRTRDSRSIRRIWEEGMVFLSHLVRLSEAPNDETLVKAYGRSAGLLLPQGFKGADIVIPIWTKKMMTFLVIQVKNRRDAVMGLAVKEDARVSLNSGVSMFTPRPHFGLYMSLRSQNQGFAAEVVNPELCPPKVTRFLKNIKRTYLWESTDRVVIAAVGLDVALYPGIAFSDSGMGASETKEILNYLKSLLNQTNQLPVPDDKEFFEGLMPLG